VDSRLAAYHSDLLLQTNARGHRGLLLYILVEHKSFPDRKVLFQLLRYMLRVWEAWIARKENRNWSALPPILPVVFSHAPRPWPYSRQFSDLVSRPGVAFASYIPRFQALLLDLARRKDTALGSDPMTRLHLQMLKHIQAHDTRRLAPVFAGMHRHRLAERHPEEFRAAVEYLLRARPGESIERILKLLPSAAMRRRAMTIAESLERKGRQEGRLQGSVAAKQEILERILDRRFGLTETERKLIHSQPAAGKLDAALDAALSPRRTTKAAVLARLRGSTTKRAGKRTRSGSAGSRTSRV
jgi:predicted transposase/invertase (TIGR01784 family)